MNSAPAPADQIETADAKRPLAELAGALSRPRQDIESAFTTVGNLVSEGATALNALHKQFEALPAYLEAQEVEDATGRLREVGAACRELTKAFEREHQDLNGLVERVKSASAPLWDLQRSVKIMSILAINARVAAAGIPGTNDDGFEVFTTDIAMLSRSANEAIEDFTRLYHHLTRQVSSAVEKRRAFETRHADTLRTLAERLDTALDDLDRHRQLAAEGSAETGAISRQISQRVAAAVMSLQVGDATRQRLEHIEDGLIAGSQADTAGADALAALELAQLADTIEQFGLDVSRIENALLELAGDAALITKRSADIYASGKQAGGSLIGVLRAQLLDAVAILRDCEAERAKMETVVTSVQDSARVLLSRIEVIQEIESGMRLVSLNAAVKCAQLGPLGASLSVIATQLRELTVKTVSAADDAMDDLKQASTLALQFAEGSAGAGAGQVGALDRETRAALDLLSGLDTTLAGALDMLEQQGPRIGQTLQNAANALGRQTGITEAMSDIRLQLTEAGAELPADFDAGAVASILAPIAAKYTMDAERAVHRAVFGELPGTPGNDAAEPEDDLDFML